MGWQLEQAEEFRQEVKQYTDDRWLYVSCFGTGELKQYTDAERVVLADAYQALLRLGPLPRPGSPLEIQW